MGESNSIEQSLQVAPGPHLHAPHLSTQKVMLDVLLALLPVVAMSVYVFRGYALKQMGLCLVTAGVVESVCAAMRRRKPPIGDLSAAVTAVILAMSLPWSAPWYVAVVATTVAIGLGKAAFGGLGFNLFNPAMVGRAFVFLSFAQSLGAGGYVASVQGLDVVSMATPLTAAKQYMAAVASGTPVAEGVRQSFEQIPALGDLVLGIVNGSLGETSVGALLLGGLYLCARRVIAFEIPLSMLAASGLALLLFQWGDLIADGFSVFHHLGSGALVFGAFFIATDPVTSPITRKGRVLFGAGLGMLSCCLRVFSSYPEGVMFAVLFMNAWVPLLNRWTRPTVIGGPVPARKA